jgi:hypothetical protein
MISDDGARRLMSEMIVLAVEQYMQLRDKGFIREGKPQFIPVGKLQRVYGHDAAYSLVRFFFTPALDRAISIGGVRIDPDHIRQKLEPEIWRDLLSLGKG